LVYNVPVRETKEGSKVEAFTMIFRREFLIKPAGSKQGICPSRYYQVIPGVFQVLFWFYLWLTFFLISRIINFYEWAVLKKKLFSSLGHGHGKMTIVSVTTFLN
jgi:hypothetical protein